MGGGGGDADQAVEDEANDGSTTPFSPTSETGRSGELSMAEDIGVAYALVGISSSVVVVVGVGGSNDCVGNRGLRGSGIGELSTGDFGKSLSCQVPGIKATGKIQVAVNVMPYP
jgi:hypothetical protein